jgi:anhydro-N-acetylmuramic acid kinase
MEAEAWAYLAVRSARDLPLTFPGTTGIRQPVSGGISAQSALLRTERLMLTRWSQGDEDRLQHLHGTEEASLYVGHGRPWDRAYAQGRIEGWRDSFRKNGYSTLKLLASDGLEFIGRAGISWYEDAAAHQLAYSIMPSQWGKGYASEIASALTHWFFTADVGERLEVMVHVDNKPSIRIIERLGFRDIGIRSVRGEPCRFFEMTRTDYVGLAKASPSRNPTS